MSFTEYMNNTKRSFRYTMISLILLVLSIILTVVEINASYEMKTVPDTSYTIISYLVRIALPTSFIYALMSVSAKKNNLGSILCILSGLGTLMVILNLINSAYQA